MSSSFDALKYFEDLKAAGMPEKVARVQADAMRDFSEIQDSKNRNELATKGDLRETELRLQKEIEQIRAELKSDIAKTKYDLLKWQIGIAIVIITMIAKGFHWLGF